MLAIAEQIHPKAVADMLYRMYKALSFDVEDCYESCFDIVDDCKLCLKELIDEYEEEFTSDEVEQYECVIDD